MNWFKKYKIVKISDTHFKIMKRYFLWKWTLERTCNNKYQAECALYRLNSKTKFKEAFSHYCSLKPTNKRYVIHNLKKMGYIPSCTFDIEQKYIYTSQNGYIYTTNDENVARIAPNSYDILYGLYCSDKDDLFLAIVAINDRNDYMQWFHNTIFDFNMCPLPNHRFLCDQETLERFGRVNNSPNTYSSGIHKKMSVESIIEMFMKN